jgi:hypothetical protein
VTFDDPTSGIFRLEERGRDSRSQPLDHDPISALLQEHVGGELIHGSTARIGMGVNGTAGRRETLAVPLGTRGPTTGLLNRPPRSYVGPSGTLGVGDASMAR